MAKSLITDRSGTWYEDFRIDKKSIRRSLKIPVRTGDKKTDKANKELALELAAKHYHDLISGKKLNKHSHTWEEAVDRYIEYRREKYLIKEQNNPTATHLRKKHIESVKDIIQKFEVVDRFLEGKDINEICQDDLLKIRRHLLETRKVSHKTVNRYLSQVRSTLIRCRDKLQNPDKTPWLAIVPSFPVTGEDTDRMVSLPPEKFWELHNALPPLHQDLMLVAVSTGLRDTPLHLMEQSWVFLKEHPPMVIVPAAFQKNGEPLAVPLPEVAVNAIKRAISRHPTKKHVFNTDHYGKPIKKASTSGWYRALEKVGLKGKFTWHDLRHVFAATHILNGTPQSVIQTLGGWKTPSMVKRYSHQDARNLHGFTDCFNTYLTQEGNDSEAESA